METENHAREAASGAISVDRKLSTGGEIGLSGAVERFVGNK